MGALSASSSAITKIRASSAVRERDVPPLAVSSNDQSAPLSPKVSARSARAVVVSDDESEREKSDNEPSRKDSQPSSLPSKAAAATPGKIK